MGPKRKTKKINHYERTNYVELIMFVNEVYLNNMEELDEAQQKYDFLLNKYKMGEEK